MEIIDQIRQVANIVEIASAYTTLKKRGSKHVGLCPFHSEKTPSFTVDENKQLFHCFGCGAGGDVFSLVMEKENLSFPEVLKHLAEKYRIPMPARSKMSPEILKLEDKIFKINEMALIHFRQNLRQTEEGKKALDYLEKRDISPQTVDELKIGYALNAWDDITSFFRAKNISDQLLEKAGLALPGQKGKGSYDRFRGRVIFPIFNLTGKVLAFGGRTIIQAELKYLNSPDTPVYTKGHHLYGLNFSKEAVREKGELILVEGYTDFSSLYAAGIKNCAASLGTALTLNQISLAQRFAPNIMINYDGDSAGLNAAVRAVTLCFEKGVQPHVLVLPDKADPDSYIRKNGIGPYLALTQKKIPGLKFLIDFMKRSAKMNVPEEKAKVVSAVIRELDKIPDAVVRSEYLRLMSDYLAVDEKLLRSLSHSNLAGKKEEESDFFLNVEKSLLYMIFEGGHVSEWILESISEEDLQGLRGEAIFKFILENVKNKKSIDFRELKQSLGNEAINHLSKLLIDGPKDCSIQRAEVCLNVLQDRSLERKAMEINRQIKQAQKAGNTERQFELIKEMRDLKNKLFMNSIKTLHSGIIDR